MKCRKAQKQFDVLYRSGMQEIPRAVGKHIAACNSCSEAFQWWTEMADALRNEAPHKPPYGFERTIMQAYEQRQAVSIRGKTGFAMRPQPAIEWALSIVLFVTAAAFMVGRPHFHSTKASYALQTVRSIRFELKAQGASSVALLGDFNNWDAQKDRLTQQSVGTWVIDVKLPRGSYAYGFLIDGKIWRLDPSNSTAVPDGFGGFNSEIDL